MARLVRRMPAFLSLTVCVALGATSLAAQKTILLVGSGSSVPSPFYNAWSAQYGKDNNDVQVRYLQPGASEGIRQISQGIGDFAAGEIPLTDAQIHKGKIPLVQFPTVLIAIVPIYKLPGETQPELRFSGELLAEIFLGNIKAWKDARIVKLNPGVDLPDLPITVVRRSPGKGSNYILTDFLAKVSPQWKLKIGKSASPKWAVGVDTNRSEDMVEKVSTTVGAIGFVELNYAQRKDFGSGSVENAAGRFVRATPESIAAACAANQKKGEADFGSSLTNAESKDAYPIVSFTNVYAVASGMEASRLQALKDFWNWALTVGQQTAADLSYTPLPPDIAARAREALNSIP